MPFGKHKGLELEEVPDDYLEWLLTIDLRPRLRRAVERELEARDHYDNYGRDDHTPREPPLSQPAGIVLSLTLEHLSLLEELLQAGYRQLALRYHPDRPTGNTKLMQQLNLLMEAVRQQLGNPN